MAGETDAARQAVEHGIHVDKIAVPDDGVAVGDLAQVQRQDRPLTVACDALEPGLPLERGGEDATRQVDEIGDGGFAARETGL